MQEVFGSAELDFRIDCRVFFNEQVYNQMLVSWYHYSDILHGFTY